MDQVSRCFFSHTLHPRNIVRAIPPKTLVIDQVLCSKTIFFFYFIRSQEHHILDAFSKGKNFYLVGHELKRISVPRNNNHIHSFLFCLTGKCANTVIRLKAGLLINRNIESLNQFLYSRNLGIEVIRGGLASRLVLLIKFIAKCSSGKVKRGRDIIWFEFLQHRKKGGRKAIHCVDRLATLSGHRRQRMIRTMDQRIPIQEHQGFYFFFHVFSIDRFSPAVAP